MTGVQTCALPIYSSGMIAGEGLVGILLAVFAIVKVGDKTVGDMLVGFNGVLPAAVLGNWGGLVFFALLVVTLVMAMTGSVKKKGKK